MDDQSVNQQGTTGTQVLLAHEAGSQSGTATQTQAGATRDLAGADAATGAGAETDATTKTGPEALQARIDELQQQNDEMRDRLARIESEEAAAQAAADRHAAEVAATSEADAAHAAAKALQVLRNTAAEAETAYRMAGLHAVQAAMAVRAGVYDPARLGAAIAGITDWSDKGTGALLSLGDIALTPGAVPARDVLDADLAAFRHDARINLGNLANAAASYAHLLEVAPTNLPSHVAIGKALEECFLAASMSLSGLGATMIARGAA